MSPSRMASMESRSVWWTLASSRGSSLPGAGSAYTLRPAVAASIRLMRLTRVCAQAASSMSLLPLANCGRLLISRGSRLAAMTSRWNSRV
ncbi:hypothetical protein D3C73_1328530 [compost metagenome]